MGKDLMIYKLSIQKEELKDNLEQLTELKKTKNELNGSADISDIMNYSKNIKELNKKYEEQKMENIKLKEKIKIIETEKDKYNKKLLSLGIKFTTSGNEVQYSQKQIFDELNNEIEQLKIKNESLDKLV
jgi:2-keto-3-deoxy-L-rhamnonate aldolase RhmA